MDLFDVVVAKKLSGGGGGGNPNRVQTITGTADNPCAGINAYNLLRALINNNASAVITLSNTSLGIYVTMPIISRETALVASTIDSATMTGFDASWDASNETAQANLLVMINNGHITEGTAHASMITSELVITWHPLP